MTDHSPEAFVGSSIGCLCALVNQINHDNVIAFVIYSVMGGTISIILKAVVDFAKEKITSFFKK